MRSYQSVRERKPLAFVLVIATILSSVLTGSAQRAAECTTRITLLQVNDVYQFAPVDRGTRGGLARVMTLKKEIQKESPHTLFLFAGDTISPSVESITYKGAQMIESWNTAGSTTPLPGIMNLILDLRCYANVCKSRAFPGLLPM